MKNIIILTMLFTLTCKAQGPIISFTDYCENDAPDIDNMYVKDIEGFLNPYIGTWIWSNNNSSITIEIIKVEMVYKENSSTKRYDDELHGRIKYISNGQTAFNTLVNGPNVIESYDCIPIDNEYRFSYKDPIKMNAFGQVYIKLFDNNTKAKFYLRNNEGLTLTPEGQTYDPNFSMPKLTEFILNKS